MRVWTNGWATLRCVEVALRVTWEVFGLNIFNPQNPARGFDNTTLPGLLGSGWNGYAGKPS
jgi:hypothetical protein